MQPNRVETDNHLQAAGECFMFLCWVESTMRDFLVLREGGKEMRSRYNESYGSNHPPEFARKRLELGRLSFGTVKKRFLCEWPEWKESTDIHEAIERIVIYRNGFGHAQVQPFRNYLLYTPADSTCKSIREFTRCDRCSLRLKDCECERDDVAEPFTLVFRCLEERFLGELYGDIRRVDEKCFLSTAKKLNVAYRGVAWPIGRKYVLAENHPV